jgi:ribosome biogenesis GTPase / thiamine phosphate phosphatase
MPVSEPLQWIGLDEATQEAARERSVHGVRIARVVAEHRESYRLHDGSREAEGEISGRLRFNTAHREDFPCVGDWVLAAGEGDLWVIQELLPRRTFLSRKAAGDRTERQPIAANLDVVFVMQGLDRPFNPRRIERSVVIVRESGARPAIILGKSDLCDPALRGPLEEEARALAPGVDVIACSSVTGEGLADIRRHLTRGVTGCLIGPSGAGKSRLVNTLAGADLLPTGEVRDADARGRHTTTLRCLLMLHGAGMIIDTPGMRELGLWQGDTGLGDTFPEIEELAGECRFRNCTHRHEPGCAVILAVEEERLSPERYESWRKLRDEARSIEERSTVAGRLERKRKEKILSREIGRVMKRKGKK